jgi:hypothetical protein
VKFKVSSYFSHAIITLQPYNLLLKNWVKSPLESFTFLFGIPIAFFMTATLGDIITGRMTGPRICEVDLEKESFGNVYLI